MMLPGPFISLSKVVMAAMTTATLNHLVNSLNLNCWEQVISNKFPLLLPMFSFGVCNGRDDH